MDKRLLIDNLPKIVPGNAEQAHGLPKYPKMYLDHLCNKKSVFPNDSNCWLKIIKFISLLRQFMDDDRSIEKTEPKSLYLRGPKFPSLL